MLGALLLPAQLPPLRSGPIRLGPARSVLCDGFAHLPAEGQPVLRAVLHGSPLSAKRVFSLSAVALHRAADCSLCHVSSAARGLPEHAVWALSLATPRVHSVKLTSW